MKINDRVLILEQNYINQTGRIITMPSRPNGSLYVVRIDSSGRGVLLDKQHLVKLEPQS